LTQASVYPQRLYRLAENDKAISLALIGSRGPDDKPASGPIRHEGYNGWTTKSFTSCWGKLARTGVYVRPDTGSPFLYKNDQGEEFLDFKRYCTEFNNGQPVDFVSFFLGCNDVFDATDQNIDRLAEQVLRHFDRLITMVRAFNKDTRIGICLLPPPSSSQDGFQGYRGPGKQTSWQYRRNAHRLVERLLEKYSQKKKERIYLIPINVNVDCDHGYRTYETVINANCAEKISRVLDGIHPAASGYNQIGDVIYCWIKACLSEKI
jgi:lysophospholipase L1-like esterase